VELESDAIFRAVVHAGAGRVLRLPPLRLPYSPEFEPRPPGRDGGRLLARLARITGGAVDPAPEAAWAGPRAGGARRSLAPRAAWLAVAVLLLEIAARRFVRPAPAPAPAVSRARAAPRPAASPKASPSVPPDSRDDIGAVLGRAKSRARRRR